MDEERQIQNRVNTLNTRDGELNQQTLTGAARRPIVAEDTRCNKSRKIPLEMMSGIALKENGGNQVMAFDFSKLRDKSKNAFQAAKERAEDLQKKVTPHVDRAAESAAKKITEMTGRETTASEVKKAAAVAAVSVGVVAVLASTGAGAAAIPQSLAGESADDGFGNDVMGQAHRFFAENGGSLNIETQYVDQDGCVLY